MPLCTLTVEANAFLCCPFRILPLACVSCKRGPPLTSHSPMTAAPSVQSSQHCFQQTYRSLLSSAHLRVCGHHTHAACAPSLCIRWCASSGSARRTLSVPVGRRCVRLRPCMMPPSTSLRKVSQRSSVTTLRSRQRRVLLLKYFKYEKICCCHHHHCCLHTWRAAAAATFSVCSGPVRMP